MKLRDLSVRYRLLLNNVIMVLIPVLLLVGIGSAVFHGLRATGNFREREMEILWPEAGDTIPVLLGLSHLFSNVDGGEDEKLERHTKSMEELGIQVAVIQRQTGLRNGAGKRAGPDCRLVSGGTGGGQCDALG